ncbi:MAG: S-layer homology domain-containing protein, partial [Paenibacillaceae bacterium]|nr:S-layer homology domain-containing protein [Paenibacillaceae bacterium]
DSGREENIGQGGTGNAASPKLLAIVGVAIKKIDAGTSDAFLISEGPSSINVPDSPTDVVAVPGNGRIDVSFVAPTYDGNSAITGYTAYARAGASVVSGQAAGSPIAIEGLTNGVPYTVTVTAANIKGESAASVSALGVTPQLPAASGYGAFSFGDNGGGQLGPRASDANATNALFGIAGLPADVVGAAAGSTHTLALTASGAVYAFGYADIGQMGVGATAAANPTRITALPEDPVAAVAAGPRHSLLLTASGAVYTFGSGSFGELGHGDEAPRSLPARIDALAGKPVAAIAAGGNFSLALTVQHEVYFFGLRYVPELGYISEQLSPVRIVGDWAPDERPIAIAAGSVHMLVLTDKGSVYSFGLGAVGQLGHGDNALKGVPTRIAGLPAGDKAVAIAAGGTNSLVLTESGAIYGFGSNTNGQLGQGDRIGRNTPTAIAALAGKRAVAIAMGDDHSFVATESGGNYALYAFGDGAYGQLGLGNAEDRLSPVPVGAFAGKKVLALAPGARHTIVVAKNPGSDTAGPAIAGAAVAADNAYIDLTASEGVFRTRAGTGGLLPWQLALDFAGNGGNATGASLVDVRRPDGETVAAAGALTGGETTVRVFLRTTGTPSGVETATLRPVNGLAVFDSAGNAMPGAQTTGALRLKDRLAPTIVSAARDDDTHVTVTLSENAAGLYNPHDGGFAVKETGGTATYAVTSTAKGADAKHVVLTIADMGESGKEGVTVNYTAGGRGAVADEAGNALGTAAEAATIAAWDTVPPAFVDARRIDDTHLEVTLSEEAYRIAQTNDGGFSVKETGSATIAYAVAAIAEGADARHVILTVAEMGVSAKEGVTIGYSATGNGMLADKAGNKMASMETVKAIGYWDQTAPTITWGALGADNAYFDVTVTEGVYSTVSGTGAPGTSHMVLTQTAGGNATSIAVQALAKTDGTTPATATPLTGGETAIRVFLSVDKPPSGTEKITVQLPSYINFLYDKAGNAAIAAPAQHIYTLNDQLAPKMLGASLGTNSSTQIVVQLSENVPDADIVKAGDGGFDVEETGSGGTVVYPVRSIAKGTSNRQIVLTVDSFARSGGKGITVVYSKGGNGTIKDAAGNEMADGSATISAWDRGPGLQEAIHYGNAYVDVLFSEGVYGSADGTGALDESFFELVFSDNGGTLVNAVLASARQADGEVEETASPLAGGEMKIRFFLALDGAPNGYETMRISVVKPIYDEFGNEFDGETTTNEMYFYDLDAPQIVSVERVSDTSIRLTFNEYIGIFDDQWNIYDEYLCGDGANECAGFAVEQTGSEGDPALAYPVSAIRLDTDTYMALELTAADMGRAAKEGVTVKYIADGHLLVGDYAYVPNSLVLPAEGVQVPAWDTVAPTASDADYTLSGDYADFTFSEGVYTSEDGTGDLTAADFELTFAAGGGHATGASIVAVAQGDAATAAEASALHGGETAVRVFYAVAGTPSGAETITIAPKSGAAGAAIYDRAGNALAAYAGAAAATLPDRLAPTIVSASRLDDTHIDVDLSEFATGRSKLGSGGFAVTETGTSGGSAVAYAVAGIAAVGVNSVRLTVADMGLSAKEGVTVTYTAGVAEDGTIADGVGNAMATDAVGAAAAAWDTDAPSVSAVEYRTDFAYADITVNEGVYGTANGTGGVSASAFELTFAAGGGTAAGVSVAAVKRPDATTPAEATALGGGETTIRLFYAVNGTSSGAETIAVSTRTGASVYDRAGNELAAYAGGGAAALPDRLAPTIVAAARADDSHLVVTLSEPATGRDAVGDGGFAVTETGGATVAYAVYATAAVGSSQIRLTVADLGVSAREGVTVTYAAGGNGVVADAAGNALATNAAGAEVAAWDTAAPAFAGLSAGPANAYVDVAVSEGVYGTANGYGGVTAAGWKLVFAAGSGGAAQAVIAAAARTDAETAAEATALAGGETTVRLFLTLTGTANGTESIELQPADGASLFDRAGNAIAAGRTAGPIALRDMRQPEPQGEDDPQPVQQPDKQPDKPAGNEPAPGAEGGIAVIVGGEEQERMATATIAETAGRRTTTVALDETALAARLDTADTGASVVVPVRNGSAAVHLDLNGRMVRGMASGDAVIVVQTEFGSYALPARQLDLADIALQLDAGGAAPQDIRFRVSIMEPPAGEAAIVPEGEDESGVVVLVAPAVDFQVTASYGGREVSVRKFDAYVERTIAIPPGVDPGRITTGVLVMPDGSLQHVPTKVVERGGAYAAVINSLTNSRYAVIYNAESFADTVGHWAGASIANMAARLVIRGVGEQRYEPDRPVTRAEFAAIAVRALGLASHENGAPFRDVSPDDWYASAAAIAAEYGLAQGEDDGSFRPERSITREETAAILARAAKLAKLEPALSAAEADAAVNAFADGGDVSGWAKEAVAAAVRLGILEGDEERLSPREAITRAQAAVVLERLLRKADLIN